MNTEMRLTGTIEAAARGMKLRDADGMWWQLFGDIDPSPYARSKVQIVGIRRGPAAIELSYCGPVVR